MVKIKVVDSIMGSGKTQSAINLMNKEDDNNYIFITPYLNEVERIKKSCSNRRFYEPKIYSKDGALHTKFDSLHELLANEKNIASTHALFKRANDETKELIHAGNYTLILDEVMNVVEELNVRKDDFQLLLDTNCVIVDDDNIIHWNHDKIGYDTRYNDIKDMAMNNTLIYFRKTVLMWTFPVDVFKAFNEVYILTYLFDAQIQKYYYDMYGLEYNKYIALNENNEYKFKEVDNTYSDKHIKDQLKDKIHIYEGKLNAIGDTKYSLSKGWFEKKNKDLQTKLKNNVGNFFKHKMKAKSSEVMWTVFKDYESKIKGQGYSKSHVSLTARATNEYKDRIYLAYTVNRFLNPIIEGFFYERNVRVNEDQYALSELLQWIWRSRIRDDKEIHLYIPSLRMRTLFIKWLNDENIKF